MSRQKCNGKMQVYSRVVGFYTPTDQWNKGKKEEFRMRKTFNLAQAVEKQKEDKSQNKSCFSVN